MWIEIIFTGYRENNLRMDKLVQANFKTIFKICLNRIKLTLITGETLDFAPSNQEASVILQVLLPVVELHKRGIVVDYEIIKEGLP